MQLGEKSYCFRDHKQQGWANAIFVPMRLLGKNSLYEDFISPLKRNPPDIC